eukprot:scaffold16824_cov23-Cyclotella_meneghiniana.AAC.1
MLICRGREVIRHVIGQAEHPSELERGYGSDKNIVVTPKLDSVIVAKQVARIFDPKGRAQMCQ